MSAPVGVVMRRAAEIAASRPAPASVAAPERIHSWTLPRGHCIYCGSRVRGIACHAHSDLPAIDPFFSPDVPQRKAEPVKDFRPEARLDRLQPQGA